MALHYIKFIFRNGFKTNSRVNLINEQLPLLGSEPSAKAYLRIAKLTTKYRLLKNATNLPRVSTPKVY